MLRWIETFEERLAAQAISERVAAKPVRGNAEKSMVSTMGPRISE